MEQDGEAYSVNITSQCRKRTNLTAMQIEHLKRIEISLPFVADLAHAYGADRRMSFCFYSVGATDCSVLCQGKIYPRPAGMAFWYQSGNVCTAH